MARRKNDVVRLLKESGLPYEYEEHLTGGSTCEVYLLEQQGKLYAMKLPKADLEREVESEVATLIRREGELLAEPKFRNLPIVQLREILELRQGTKMLPALLMDYCDSGTLQQRISEDQQWDAGTTIDTLVPLLEPLAVLHELGFTHNDISPRNIFINGGRAILADLGIARKIRKSTETVLGTPAHVPPELNPDNPKNARGEAHRFRAEVVSDLYSFAAVLYQVLADRPLLAEEWREAYAQAIDPRFIDAACARVGPTDDPKYRELRTVLRSVLDPDPARRAAVYGNAREFARALQAARQMLVQKPIDIAALVESLQTGYDGTLIFTGQPEDAKTIATHLIVRSREGEVQRISRLAECLSEVTARPEDVQYRYFLARLLRNEQRIDPMVVPLALREVDRALSMDPEFTPAHNLRAMLLRDLANQTHTDEERLLGDSAESARAAIARDPQNANYHMNLGMTLRRKGDYDGAWRCYQRVQELEPGHPALPMRLASYYEHIGHPELTGVWYQRAIASGREHRRGDFLSYVHYRFARYLVNRGEFGEAVRHCLQSIECDSGYLGEVLQLLDTLPSHIRQTEDAERVRTVHRLVVPEQDALRDTLERTLTGGGTHGST